MCDYYLSDVEVVSALQPPQFALDHNTQDQLSIDSATVTVGQSPSSVRAGSYAASQPVGWRY